MTLDALAAQVTAAVEQRDARREGRELRFRCPNPGGHARGDEHPSARWNPEKAVWKCDVCRAKGGARALAKWLGIEGQGDRRSTGRQISKNGDFGGPTRAARRSGTVTTYPLHDEGGKLVATHMRLDRPGQKKACWWELPGGTRGLDGLPVHALPLYGAPELAAAEPSARVVLVEGEKACEALRRRGILAVATVTGAAIAPSEDSLRALVGHETVLWADNDPAGAQHMRDIGGRLIRLGVTPRLVSWPDAPPAGDAADFTGDDAALEALIDAATCVSVEESSALVAAALPTTTVNRPEAAADAPAGRPSQATQLARLADELVLLHSADGTAYADVTIGDDGHRETHAVRSRALRDYLIRRYYLEHLKVPSNEAVREALAVLEARARFDGEEHPVAVRVAGDADVVYLDLGDASWRVVEITRHGWRIAPSSAVRFVRPAGLLALPEPVLGGNCTLLRPFVRVARDEDFYLTIAWCLAALRPRGPFPVLNLQGEPGSAKTTTGRVVRSLIDPNVAPVRAEPRESRDLVVAGRNGWVVALDNVSRLSPWLSDDLCRLATGGGFGARELYTDAGEVLVDLQRPCIVTGIEDVCTRSDLADRALVVTLPAMPEDARRPERELWPAIAAVRPALLGALCTAVARGLLELPTVRLDRFPRMADFAEWCCACEPALGVAPRTLLKAYETNRSAATEATIEGSAVGTAVRALMADLGTEGFEGTPGELLARLKELVKDEWLTNDARRWPQGPRKLSGELRQLAPALRGVGIDVQCGHREATRQRRRLVRVVPIPAAVDGVDGRPERPAQPSNEKRSTGAGSDGVDGVDGLFRTLAPRAEMGAAEEAEVIP